jgi:hypothetical protein
MARKSWLRKNVLEKKMCFLQITSGADSMESSVLIIFTASADFIEPNSPTKLSALVN